MKITYMTKEEVREYIDIHICIGDKTDGIHNIKKGWGEKTALKNLPQLKGFLKTDQDMANRYQLNKTMIDLKELPEDIEEEIISLYKEKQGCYNGIKLMALFRKYKLLKSSEDISKLRMKGDMMDDF